MSGSTTFSPDATLAGPIVHVLRGAVHESVKKPCQLEKGERIYYYRNRQTGEARFSLQPKNIDGFTRVDVIPAEALVVHTSDYEISVPVVVAGRTENIVTPEITGRYGAGLELKDKNNKIHARTIHPETFIEGRKSTVEVFIDHFGSPPNCVN